MPAACQTAVKQALLRMGGIASARRFRRKCPAVLHPTLRAFVHHGPTDEEGGANDLKNEEQAADPRESLVIDLPFHSEAVEHLNWKNSSKRQFFKNLHSL